MLRVLQLENDPPDLLKTLDPEEHRCIIEEDEETGEVEAVDYSDQIVGMIGSAGASSKRSRCSLIEDLVSRGARSLSGASLSRVWLTYVVDCLIAVSKRALLMARTIWPAARRI